MKHILVPTDFSKPAHRAIDYAIDFANHFGSRITLLHTYKVYSTAGMLVSVESHIREQATRDLLDLAREVEPRLKNGARLDTKLLYGDVVPSIARLADRDYDIIIMGTKGSSDMMGLFTGSITNGVIRESNTPVLAIPDDFMYRPIDTIALAVDGGPISGSRVLAPVVRIARAYQARVLVFHQNTDNEEPGLDPTVDMYLEGTNHSFHFELDYENINDSINDFVREESADLLCMIHRERSFLGRLFRGSTTSRTAFDSPAPLLVLYDEV